MDCVVGEWSDWSQCTKVCGGGTQKRTRSIVTQPCNGGDDCPPLEETRPCNTQSCTNVPFFPLCLATPCDKPALVAADVSIGAQDGSALLKVKMKAPLVADIRGIFFDMPNLNLASLGCSVQALSPLDTLSLETDFNTNVVVGVPDVNLDQCPTLKTHPFSVASAIGTASYSGVDDVREVVLKVSCPQRPMSVWDFKDGQFGVRVTSMATSDTNGQRTAQATLACVCPPGDFPDNVPPPPTNSYGRRRRV